MPNQNEPGDEEPERDESAADGAVVEETDHGDSATEESATEPVAERTADESTAAEQSKREAGSDEQYCSSCGEPIKKEAELCPHCGVRQKSPSSRSEKNAGLAALASAVGPGLGQIYNGQILKGIILIVLAGISVMLMLVIIGFITYPIVWIYAVYDAYTTAEGINADEITPDA